MSIWRFVVSTLAAWALSMCTFMAFQRRSFVSGIARLPWRRIGSAVSIYVAWALFTWAFVGESSRGWAASVAFCISMHHALRFFGV